MPKSEKSRVIKASNFNKTKKHRAITSTTHRMVQETIYVHRPMVSNQTEDQVTDHLLYDSQSHFDGMNIDNSDPLPYPPASNLPDESVEEPGRVQVKVKGKAKRYEDSDVPLLSWKQSYREDYAEWAFVSEARGRHFNGLCGICASGPPNTARFRCLDCFGYDLICKGCVLLGHQSLPLHRIEEWRADRFHPISLKSLGLRVQLGHAGRLGPRLQPGSVDRISCPNPKRSHEDFVVMAINGIHVVNVVFCHCAGDEIDHRHQLLEIGWWPASSKDPRSAATFELLRHFHVTNLQGHIPMSDYFNALEQLTDGTGLEKIPDRAEQFRVMVREWRHIKMGKRAGRVHDPSGLAGTQHGAATVLCRACPHPGINLPRNWEKSPASVLWLYALFLSIDANFKQKARARANDNRDPALGPGWGVFVDNVEYMDVIKNHTSQDEISHCVGFSAIWNANTKKSKGLRASGVGAVSCSRHECFRPNGMGDLQKGERYVNMDSILLQSIAGSLLLLFVLSYDIACQWNINFRSRMLEMPSHWRIPSDRHLKFKVPKFHLLAHIEKCYAEYAFEYTEGVGNTDGEAIERNWSEMNQSARSLSMMTAGSRWDTTDDTCNFWNYRKTIGLDATLLNKLVKAISGLVIHERSFRALNDALMVDHAEKIAEWTTKVTEWEQRKSKECPYDIPESSITVAKVKKAMADEDHAKEKAGENQLGTTLSAMIVEGLEIEETQRQIAASATIEKAMEYQQTNLVNRRTHLLGRIRRWRKVQVAHVPGLGPLIENVSPDVEAEEVPLFLPSSLDNLIRKSLCSKELLDLEERLREAQAHESLAKLRGQLRARTITSKSKDKVLPSQGTYRRSHTLQAQIETRIQAYRDLYRQARLALLQLRGSGDWEKVLQVLTNEDVRGFSERVLQSEEAEAFRKAQESAGLTRDQIEEMLLGDKFTIPTVSIHPVLARGQSKQTLSWIWYTLDKNTLQDESGATEGASVAEIEGSLRVEWCKARAKARRAREEVLLVEEEMRRAIEFCQWKAQWWTAQIGRRSGLASWKADGLNAYATEQAQTEVKRAVAWTKRLYPVRERAKEIMKWLGNTCAEADVDEQLNRLAPLEVELDIVEQVKS